MTNGRRWDLKAVATRSVVEPPAPSGALYVAVVHAPDGVRFATASASRADLVRRLSDYVRERCGYALWADDARYVRSLLVRGELEAAVEVYFGRVGGRWDREWLVTTAIVTGEAAVRSDSASRHGSSRALRVAGGAGD